MEKNISLIGMPGAGKSTIGVVLAKVLGYRFMDGDLVIQEKTGKLLSEIIAEVGNEGFTKVEEDVTAGLDCERTVISTGGSVVYGKRAMEHLKEISDVVYLKLPYEVIERRLGDLKARGVVLKEGQSLRDLYNERCPLYEKYADVVVNVSGGDVADCIERLMRELRE